MATELERLQVVIEATTAPFKSSVDEVKSEVRRLQSEIKNDISGDSGPQIKPDVNIEEGLSKIEKLKLSIKAKLADMKVGTGLFDYTDEFKTIMNDSEQAEQKVRALEIALENARTQEGPDSDSFQYFNEELDNSRQKIDELNAAAIEALGGGPITVFKGLAAALKTISVHALSAAKSLGQLAMNGIQKATGAFGALIKKMFSANSLFKKFRGGSKGIGLSADSIGGAFKKMLRYGFGIRSLYALVNKLRNTVITGLQNMAKAMPGSEIARNVNTVSATFSQLKASVAAAAAPLFNALAPALNSVMQIAISAANAVGMFMAALTGKKFTAATAGASDAANSVGNVGSAADKANDSAKKLKRTLMGFDQINKLNDDDDSGSSGSSGGGSGGGGSGTSYGSYEDMPISQDIKDFVDKIKESWKNADFTDIGRMVGEKLNAALESIPWDKIKETARKIAKSLATFLNGFIEATDWELVGKTFAEGLNTVIEFAYTFVTTFNWKKFGEAIGRAINGFVDNVDTEKLKETGTELGKGIADALNGALEKTNWDKVGSTFGEGVNTVINAGHSFVTTFKWDTFGTSVADAFNGAVKTIDWEKATDTLSKGLAGILTSIASFLEELDWGELAKDIEKAVKGIDFSSIASALSEGIGAALGGLAKLVGTLISDAFTNIKDYFGKSIEDSGGNVVEGILKGITDGLKNIGTWIKENIFDPFIKGFKKAFGIASPSKEMEEPGKNIIDGVLQGMLDGIKNVSSWIKENILSPIGSAVGSAKATVKIGLEKASTWVADAWTALKSAGSTAVSTVKAAVEKASTWVADAWTAVKHTGGTVTKTVKSEVKKAGTWVSDAWAAACKTTGSITRTLKQIVKSGSWSSDAWAAAKKAGKTVTRTLKQNVKSGSWSSNAWAAAQKLSGTVTRTLKISVSWFGSRLSEAWKVLTGRADGGIYYGGSWHPVTAAAGGGSFNQGQMFIAREAGPELVGTIGGHTAVMNNNQIVSSVAAGVYRAVLAAMSANPDNGTTEVHIHLEGDAKKLFKVVQTEANDYVGSTGLAPFPV